MRVWRMRTGISITLKPADRPHNAKPTPFIWTADPDKIIQAVRRGHQVLDSIH